MLKTTLLCLLVGCAAETQPIGPDAGSGSSVGPSDPDDPADMSESSASWLVAGAMCARSASCGTDLARQPDCGGLAHAYLCREPGYAGFENGDCSPTITVSGPLVEECLSALAVAPCDLSRMPDACLHAVGAGTWRQP